MPDCDYCDAEFDDEEAYLRHLGDEHEGELKRIDQRRVEEARQASSSSSSTSTLALGAIAVLAVVGVGAFLLGGGLGGDTTTTPGPDGSTPSGPVESWALYDSGNQTYLQGVQTYEYTNAQHVNRGTDLNYRTMPPTGGPHYGGTVDASPGFYEQTQNLGDTIHNLEHGHVVIYYDPGVVSGETKRSLREFAQAHTSGWAAVVVMPNPNDDPQSPVVLTAWGKMLRMDDYDPRVVHAFLSEYLGRGPENPVR